VSQSEGALAWAVEALALSRKTHNDEAPRPLAVGPNGHPIGHDDDGNFVEWIPDEERQETWPLILRRSDAAIAAAHDELRSKIWWHRVAKSNHEGVQHTLRGIENKYGRANLEAITDAEWLIMLGRLSALSYVMGAEWDESMDLSEGCPPDGVSPDRE
jgi:hypothetical protein